MRLVITVVLGAMLAITVASLLCAENITIKDGELIIIRNHGDNRKITNTGGKITRFLMSPDNNYVAYAITVGFVPEHNDAPEIDNEVREVPVSNIEIYDLKAGRAVAKITPPIDSCEFIYTEGWVSENELLLHDADGVAVCSTYKYDVLKKQLTEIEYEEYDKKLKTILKLRPN